MAQIFFGQQASVVYYIDLKVFVVDSLESENRVGLDRYPELDPDRCVGADVSQRMSDQVGCYLLQFVGIDRQDQRVVWAVQMYIDVFLSRYTIEPVYHVPDTRYDVGRTDLKCQLSLVQFLIVELLLDQSDEAEAVALDFGEAVGIVSRDGIPAVSGPSQQFVDGGVYERQRSEQLLRHVGQESDFVLGRFQFLFLLRSDHGLPFFRQFFIYMGLEDEISGSDDK